MLLSTPDTMLHRKIEGNDSIEPFSTDRFAYQFSMSETNASAGR